MPRDLLPRLDLGRKAEQAARSAHSRDCRGDSLRSRGGSTNGDDGDAIVTLSRIGYRRSATAQHTGGEAAPVADLQLAVGDPVPRRAAGASPAARAAHRLLSLQRKLARQVTQEIFVAIQPAETRQLAATGVDPHTYDLYLRGRFFWNRRTRDDLK